MEKGIDVVIANSDDLKNIRKIVREMKLEQSLRDKLIEIARDTKKAGRKLGKTIYLGKKYYLNSIKNSLLKNSEKEESFSNSII